MRRLTHFVAQIIVCSSVVESDHLSPSEFHDITSEMKIKFPIAAEHRISHVGL